jgi:hypothetical protein
MLLEALGRSSGGGARQSRRNAILSLSSEGDHAMPDRPDDRPTEIKLDPASLFLEEVFTDRRIGTIRRLTPVKRDGSPDPSRAVAYVGETQVMSAVGTLPIVFEIEATSLAEAAEKFGPLAREAIERTMRELQELRRRAASSIVVPQGGIPDLTGGGRGGGKIQLP